LFGLLTAGILTGNELGIWAVVHPALSRLPHPVEVSAEQEITRRYGLFMPVLMIATIVGAFASSATLDGEEAQLALAGAFCFLAMLGLTFAGNVPLNVKTLRFPNGSDPAAWREIRSRWDRLHTIRVLLDTAGFALLIASAV